MTTSNEQASASSGGWFRRRVGAAASGEETDSLTVTDFVGRTKDLFKEVGLKRVVAIWIGNSSVYRATGTADKNNRDESDNLDEAFAAASNSKSMGAEDGNADEAGLRAHGFGQDFETEFTVTLKRRHPPANPSITLEILALPVEFSWRSGEEVPERTERLKQLKNDKAALKSKGEEATAKMQAYVRSLQDTLRRAYDARDVTCGFKVNLAGMVW
jgi:hypothetical protein